MSDKNIPGFAFKQIKNPGLIRPVMYAVWQWTNCGKKAIRSQKIPLNTGQNIHTKNSRLIVTFLSWWHLVTIQSKHSLRNCGKLRWQDLSRGTNRNARPTTRVKFGKNIPRCSARNSDRRILVIKYTMWWHIFFFRDFYHSLLSSFNEYLDFN